MFKILMAFLGYEKKKPAPISFASYDRVYRYVLREDLGVYQDSAKLDGFELRIVASIKPWAKTEWVTLHLKREELFALEARGLVLLK